MDSSPANSSSLLYASSFQENTVPTESDQPMLETAAPSRRPPLEDPDPQVTLQIGGKKFQTRHSTLTDGSAYFNRLFFSGLPNRPSDDGSYFVDADADIFPVLLRYLRRDVFPTFFDRNQRFDQDLCRAVRAEADYFGIQGLLDYIDHEKYLNSFTTEYSVEERMTLAPSVPGSDPVLLFRAPAEANTEQTFYPSRGVQAVYECPRNIPVHEGHPEKCGRQCSHAKSQLEATGGSCYVDRGVVRALVVTKKTVFHDGNARVGREQDYDLLGGSADDG